MRKKLSEVPPMGLFLFAALAALILFAAVGVVRGGETAARPPVIDFAPSVVPCPTPTPPGHYADPLDKYFC